jgi:hypothetical protein
MAKRSTNNQDLNSSGPESRTGPAQLRRLVSLFKQGMGRQDWLWLLRGGFVARRGAEGFILPTVTLLLLMLSLTVGLLISRTANRSEQVIGQRKQREVYNAATPAIERAKSKLEYLFTQGGLPVLPAENDIVQVLGNPTYDIPGEKRLLL